MPTEYLVQFELALDKYKRQAERPGYPNGLFTSLRHSRYEYPAVALLRNRLREAISCSAAKDIIIQHFKKHPNFHNHSFNTYLVDELRAAYPEEGWEAFDPKPILFYKGLLFRGTITPQDEAAVEGLRTSALPDDVETLLSPFNGDCGQSASKDFSVALSYADPNIGIGSRRQHRTGYVYLIDYKGEKGYDLVETHKKRARGKFSSLSLFFLPEDEKEVNIAETISPYDLVCAFKVKRFTRRITVVYHLPGYVADRHQALIERVCANFKFGESVEVRSESTVRGRFALS